MSKKPDDDAPKYVNYTNLMHSQNEFFMDFISLHPPITTEIPPQPTTRVASGKIVGRFVMSPAQAKRILLALTINIQRYEAQHGEILVPQEPSKITLN